MTDSQTVESNPAAAAGSVPNTFLLRWTAVTVLAWFLIGMLFGASGFEIGEIVWLPKLTQPQLAVVYLIMGIMLGLLQWLGLRGTIPSAAWWGLATFVGTTVGVFLSFLLTPEDPDSTYNQNWGVDILWIHASVAILQSLTLRRERVRRWYLWPPLKFLAIILVSLLGTVLALGGLINIPYSIPANSMLEQPLPRICIGVCITAEHADLEVMLGSGLFVASCYGLIFGLLTGMILSWLISNKTG